MPSQHLSVQTRQRLLHERTGLLQRRRDLEAALSTDADAVGDRADEADRLGRGDQLASVNRRIDEIMDALGSFEDPGARNLLPDGTTVTVRYADGGQEDLTVVAAVASDARALAVESVLTQDSPLGLALAGAKVGDTVTYRAPAGEATATVLALASPGE